MKDSNMNKIALEIAMKEFEDKKANDSNVKLAEDTVEISDGNELISNALAKDVTLLNPSSEVNETEKPDKPDKPDKTDHSNINNEEFINKIFGELPPDTRLITSSFNGNPGKVSGNSWHGTPFIKGKSSLPSNANNYFTLATYIPNENGKWQRQDKYFSALFGVVLDDVGSKIPIERITLEPSWILETSSRNFQYGYIFDTPITNAAEGTNVLASIIAAGLCDKGAGGATARYSRLPSANNGKSDFPCRLSVWKPHLRYTMNELADGLNFELKDISKGKTISRKSVADNDHEVHIPRAVNNPVIVELLLKGLYKSELGIGKHDITCPWLAAHTDEVDQGTAFWEKSPTFPLGGFKCLHGHCTDKNIISLLEHLGISKDAAKHLPIIRMPVGEIPRIVDSAELELSKISYYFQKGGLINIVYTDAATGITKVTDLKPQNVLFALAGVAVWQKCDNKGKWNTCDPTDKIANFLYNAVQYNHIPVLNNLAHQPFLRPDGSLATLAGYDAKTGHYGVFNPSHFSVPDFPTKEEAKLALVKITDLLSEFAFKTPNDLAAAISAILAAAVRPSLKIAPMFHAAAPQIASGKSFLCQIISSFATPEISTPHSFPSDDTEMQKLLIAEFMKAPAVLNFDNLTTDILPHKTLCTAITSEYISGRMLGHSKIVVVGTRTLLLSSGNNVEPLRDMTRRVITIRLDPKCETPATREYTNNPVEILTKNRGEYVTAALTIIRAWVVAGRPEAEVKPINSFSEWSQYCRQSLIWLGLDDPAACVFDSMTYDPAREELGFFIVAVLSKYNVRAISVKSIAEDAAKCSDLKDALPFCVFERDGNTINKAKLGWWIKRNAGCVVNGLRIVADSSVTANSNRWRVESITDQSALSVLSALSAPDSEFSNKLTISSFDDDDTSNDLSIVEFMAKYQDPIKVPPITKTTESLGNIPRNIKPDKFTYENVKGLDS